MKVLEIKQRLRGLELYLIKAKQSGEPVQTLVAEMGKWEHALEAELQRFAKSGQVPQKAAVGSPPPRNQQPGVSFFCDPEWRLSDHIYTGTVHVFLRIYTRGCHVRFKLLHPCDQ
jgi:hypothetical protein